MLISANNKIKPFIKTTVGYINVNKSWVIHNNSYECAAWWEDRQVITGVYPLILDTAHFFPNNLILTSTLNAVVVDDFFPAMYGGVAIGCNPYKPQNIGQRRTIRHNVGIIEAVVKTGNIPGENIDIYLNPEMIDLFISAARDELAIQADRFKDQWNEYAINGDGNYNSNLSSVHYLASNIKEISSGLEKLLWEADYRSKNTDYHRELMRHNTSWVPNAA